MDFFPIVFEKDGEAVTTSRVIAEHFEKSHAHILRDIQTTMNQLNETKEGREFNQANFGLVEYTDKKGENRPMYVLTRDGFTLLAMGFTGAKALQFKIAYINAFNRMAGMISGTAAAATLQNENSSGDTLRGEIGVFIQALANATQSGEYVIIPRYRRKRQQATYSGELLGVYDNHEIRIFASVAYPLYCQLSKEPLSRSTLYELLYKNGFTDKHRTEKPLSINGTKRAGIYLYRSNKKALAPLTLAK